METETLENTSKRRTHFDIIVDYSNRLFELNIKLKECEIENYKLKLEINRLITELEGKDKDRHKFA
jgi:hypothetical protein